MRLCLVACLIIINHKSWAQQPVLICIHESMYQCIKNIIRKQKINNVKLQSFSRSSLILQLRKHHPDIIIGIDNSQIHESYISSITAKIPKQFFTKLTVPFEWTNEFYIPFAYMYGAFFYNSKKVQLQQTNLEQFLCSAAKQSIILPDPRTSSIGRVWLSWLHHNRTRLPHSLLKQKVACYPKNWQACFTLFHNNNAHVMFGYTTSYLYYLANNISHVKWINFTKQPHPIKVFTVIVNKNSNHTKLTITKILTFLYSKPLQDSLTQCYCFPVIDTNISDEFKLCIPLRSYVPIPVKETELINSWFIGSI